MKKNTLIIFSIITVLLLANFQLMAILQPAKKSILKESFLKKQFCLRSGLNIFSVNGADSDYITGTNDFPVTPAYKAPVFGIGLTFFTSPLFAIGFDVRYGLSAKVDLRDPSDGEIFQVDAPKNIIAALNLFKYFNLSQQMQLFISLGGGGEYRMVEEKEYISNLGNKIVIAAPQKTLSPLAAGGIGLQAMLSHSLGIALDFQADYILRKTKQLLISPSLALVLKI